MKQSAAPRVKRHWWHWRNLLPIVLVVIGLGLMIGYGIRSYRSFQEFQYIQREGLDRGTADVSDIRPWMSIRFVAVAFAVPEEYLYSALNIPFDRRNADRPLGRLNRDYNMGTIPNTDPPDMEIMQLTRDAITAYRANPVVTGLNDVRGWMSVRYISNSTGVPVSYIFQQMGVPETDNADKPLFLLKDQYKIEGDPKSFDDKIKQSLDAYKETK